METAQSQEKTPTIGAELRLPAEEAASANKSPGMGNRGQWAGRGRPGPNAVHGSGRSASDAGTDRQTTDSDRRESTDVVPQSPRLHSLPDNALNPLGLLAEASLQNSHRKKLASVDGSGASSKGKGKELGGGKESEEGVGIGSEHYFKPGECDAGHTRRTAFLNPLTHFSPERSDEHLTTEEGVHRARGKRISILSGSLARC